MFHFVSLYKFTYTVLSVLINMHMCTCLRALYSDIQVSVREVIQCKVDKERLTFENKYHLEVRTSDSYSDNYRDR